MKKKFIQCHFLSQYNVICSCETRLDGVVSDSELQLKEYKLYRLYSWRFSNFLEKHVFVSKQLDIVLLECCVACSITLDNLEIVLCTLYNPPDDSKYRNEIANFKLLLDSLPKTTPLIVCGDMNLPIVDWITLCSSDDYELRVIGLFDHHMLRQVVDFPTRANNTIDLVFQT